MAKNPIPKAGEIYQDRSGEPRLPNKRTIEIAHILPNGVMANVLTDIVGVRHLKPRATTMTLKTLRSGYYLIRGE